MDYRDIPDLFCQLAEQECLSARALEFTILTAARTREVILAKRREFNLEEALWSIPAHRMKTHAPHQVPLSHQTVELGRELMRKHNQSHIFRGIGKSGRFSNNSMRRFLQVTLGKRHLTVHGFRSTFRIWAAENEYDRLAVEFCLAHQLKDSVEAAYLRSTLIEKRKILMQDWAGLPLWSVPGREKLSVTYPRHPRLMNRPLPGGASGSRAVRHSQWLCGLLPERKNPMGICFRP